MDCKQDFITIWKASVTRNGADKLLNWLQGTDFFTAPASTRFHLSEEGGLVKHSLNVYRRLCGLIDYEYRGESPYTPETVAVVSLLHDVCKSGFYKQEMRNVKENGIWVQKPYYTVDDKFPMGHGEKSVFLIERFMRLTTEEALAIRWHMGGFDDAVKGGSFAVGAAFDLTALSTLLHIADMMASHLDEVQK